MSLSRGIVNRWSNTLALNELIDFSRVFVGRLPSTEEYPMPFVSILISDGGRLRRSDKTEHSYAIVSFHIWVDDTELETADEVAEQIRLAYANQCFALSDTARVIESHDMGEPIPHQTVLPTIKAWEVVKLISFTIERDRSDAVCCTDLTYTPENFEGSDG